MFTFRHPRDISEMAALARLRYNVFKASHPKLVPNNAQRLELDAWDPLAHQFGVFADSDERAVGYMRLIVGAATESGRLALRTGMTYGISGIADKPLVPLPVLGYYSQAAESIRGLLEDVARKNERLFEASRMCLHPDVQTRRLSRFMTDCAVSIFFHDSSSQNAIITCAKSHERMYVASYFEHLGGCDHVINCHASTPDSTVLVLLQAQKSRIPGPSRARWQRIADEFRCSGGVRRPADASFAASAAR